jgi:hypothetical protein
MKRDILGDEKNGIQKVIFDIENSIRKGMNSSHLPFLSRSWKLIIQARANPSWQRAVES